MGRHFALPTSLKPNRHLASEQRAALVAVAFKYLGDLESATRTAEVAEYFATGRHNDLHQRRSLWKTANELERLTRTPARLQARLGTLDFSTALALGGYKESAKSDAPRRQALRRFQRLQQQKNPASPEVLEAIAEFCRRA